MYNAKHAMYIREKYPDVDVTVFYIDVRTPGKSFDEFQRRAVEEYGVHYVRGQVGNVVVDGDGKLTVPRCPSVGPAAFVRRSSSSEVITSLLAP